MDGGSALMLLLLVVGGAVLLLKGFDRVAGRGPQQVKDGVEAAETGGEGSSGHASSSREPCPYCAEDIKPAAKICRFCDRDLPEGWADA